MVISIEVSISPNLGSSDLSFRNNPTIPHIAISSKITSACRADLESDASTKVLGAQLLGNFFSSGAKKARQIRLGMLDLRQREL